MSRISSDEVVNGTVKTGFDYSLQIWVKDFICQDVGLNRDKYASKDIRTIPERDQRQ